MWLGQREKGDVHEEAMVPDEEDVVNENQKFILSKCKDLKHEVKILCDDKKSLDYHIYTGGCV